LGRFGLEAEGGHYLGEVISRLAVPRTANTPVWDFIAEHAQVFVPLINQVLICHRDSLPIEKSALVS
jgi:hypothetical protein